MPRERTRVNYLPGLLCKLSARSVPFSLVSRARYTSPMPPAPTGEAISYGPSLVPEVSAIDARNYSPYTSHRGPTILNGLAGNSDVLTEAAPGPN